MLSQVALFTLCLGSVALAELGGPYEETAIANLPTSSNPDDKFEFTNGTGWFDPENRTHIEFTGGIAGWRIVGIQSSEALFTYTRNVQFDGQTGQTGADLNVFTNLAINITYGDDNSTSLANTIQYTDQGCGVKMNYTATVYDQDGNVDGPSNALSELVINAPENVLNVTLKETDDVSDDWQVAVYGNETYLQVLTGKNAPKIEADQAIQYRYCPEGY